MIDTSFKCGRVLGVWATALAVGGVASATPTTVVPFNNEAFNTGGPSVTVDLDTLLGDASFAGLTVTAQAVALNSPADPSGLLRASGGGLGIETSTAAGPAVSPVFIFEDGDNFTQIDSPALGEQLTLTFNFDGTITGVDVIGLETLEETVFIGDPGDLPDLSDLIGGGGDFTPPDPNDFVTIVGGEQVVIDISGSDPQLVTLTDEVGGSGDFTGLDIAFSAGDSITFLASAFGASPVFGGFDDSPFPTDAEFGLTSLTIVVPEPGALTLLAVAGAVLLGRRRIKA